MDTPTAKPSEPGSAGEALLEAGPDGRRLHLLLGTLFCFQFFHWFKPSEAFFADYVFIRYGISRSTLVADVYAWDTPFQIGAAVLMLTGLVALGSRAALLLSAAAAVATVAIVLFARSFTALLISQATWAVSFTALFLVPAVLYWLAPPDKFQTVASLNNCAMLCASLSANLFSFVVSLLAPEMVCGSSSTSQYRMPFLISLGSAGLSLLSLMAGWYAGWIPENTLGSRSMGSLAGLRAQMHTNITSISLVLWLLVSAFTRGIHTQIVTLWPLVSYEIAPKCTDQRFNSLISFVAYLGAAVAVLLPARYSKTTAAYGKFAVAPFFLLSGMLLLGISVSKTLWQLGAWILAYNSCSELLLTVASARIAHAALAAARVPENVGAQYMLSMAVKYLGSLVVETITMLIVWPRWGRLNNMFGIQLDVRGQIKALGVILLVGFAFAVAITMRDCARLGRCANYEHLSPR